jgi:hypothetical protein
MSLPLGVFVMRDFSERQEKSNLFSCKGGMERKRRDGAVLGVFRGD